MAAANVCLQGWLLDEIPKYFGESEDLGECNHCRFMTYSNGIMTCKLISTK